MKRQFEILISFRTPYGFKAIGQYFLGNDAVFAESVFAGLDGCADVNDKAALHLDLMEIADDIPEKIKTISCRLSELSNNCKHITRALYQLHAMKTE